MLRIVSTLSLGLLVLTACPGDDTGTTAGGSAGSSTTSTDPTDANPTDTAPPSTTTAGETEVADTTAGMTTDATTTDSPTTDATTADATTTDATTTDGTTGVVDACAMCVEATCPEQLANCQENPTCVCFQECVEVMGSAGVFDCIMDCPGAAIDGDVQALIQCSSACASECGV